MKNTTCLIAIVLFLNQNLAQADVFSRIDEAALHLEKQVRDIHRELRYGFGSYQVTRGMLERTARLQRSAAHLHEVAHETQDVEHMQADLRTVTRDYAHLAQLLTRLRRDCHSRGLRNIDRLIARTEASIDRLDELLELAEDDHCDHGHGHDPFVPGYGRGGYDGYDDVDEHEGQGRRDWREERYVPRNQGPVFPEVGAGQRSRFTFRVSR